MKKNEKKEKKIVTIEVNAVPYTNNSKGGNFHVFKKTLSDKEVEIGQYIINLATHRREIYIGTPIKEESPSQIHLIINLVPGINN